MIQIILFTLAIGILIGILLERLLLYKHSKPSENAKQLAADFQAYKSQVNEHFDQSSEMFREITEQYVKLYNHMSKSSATLYDDKQPGEASRQHLQPIEIKPVIVPSAKNAQPQPTEGDNQS